MTLAITGSTGRLGGRVAARLAEAGVAQRLVVRSPDRAPRLQQTTVSVAAYADGEAVSRALDGIDTVLFVSAAEHAERLQHHFSFVDAAAAAGVRHIVYTSFYGAAPDATFTLARDHFATEERIKASGVAWTFLRDNLYADFIPNFADEAGVIRGPAGDGRVAAVATDDVADAVVAVLTDVSTHAGSTYDLTGPEALTMTEAASVLTECLGKHFSFVDETVEEAYTSRACYGADQWQLDAWVSTYTSIASGELAGVSEHVEQLTRRPPTPLSEVLRR